MPIPRRSQEQLRFEQLQLDLEPEGLEIRQLSGYEVIDLNHKVRFVYSSLDHIEFLLGH